MIVFPGNLLSKSAKVTSCTTVGVDSLDAVVEDAGCEETEDPIV